jgi:hypothetical protein
LVTWIRIRINQKSRSGSKFISWIRSQQFTDAKPKCIEHEPILALFQEFEPFFEAIDLNSDPDQGEKLDSDTHQIKNQNPDPQQNL